MCSCQNNKIGMRKRIGKRKQFNASNLQNIVMQQVLPGAAGYVVGEVLDGNIKLLAQNNTTASFVKIGGGLLLATMFDGFVGAAGVGMALNGTTNLVLPKLAALNIAGINLLAPGERTYHVAGVPAQLYAEKVTVQ
jgi:hypothetical protein